MRHQRVVQAVLGQLIGLLPLPGLQRVARRRVDQAMAGQPDGRALVQSGPLGGRQRVEALAQGVARQRVHAQPVALLARHEDRGVPRQAGQPLGRIRRLHQLAAQFGVQVIQHRDPGQEGQRVRIEVGQQMGDEALAQLPAPGLQRQHAGALGAALVQHRQGQLQAQRPAFGHFVQAGRHVAVGRGAEAVAHQFDGFLDAEAQLGGSDDGALPVADQVVDAELAVAARGDDHQQVGRHVAQQIAQRLARRPGQAIRLVHDQHDVHGRLRHLGQPDRDAFQVTRRRGVQQHMAEGRPARADAHRQRQPLGQPGRVVLGLRRQPGHHGAARQVLAPPLRQQRGLAETGWRLHQHDRVIAPAGVVRVHAGTCHQMPGHARRRDLQEQVAGRRSGSRGHLSGIPGLLGMGGRHAVRCAGCRRFQGQWELFHSIVPLRCGRPMRYLRPPAGSGAGPGRPAYYRIAMGAARDRLAPAPRSATKGTSCITICWFRSMAAACRSRSWATPSAWRAPWAPASRSFTPSPITAARCRATSRCCA